MPSEKPVVSVRLPDDLRKAVDELAKQQDRSRNWVITDLIRKALTAQ
jgi:predicted transcriptional regulator